MYSAYKYKTITNVAKLTGWLGEINASKYSLQIQTRPFPGLYCDFVCWILISEPQSMKGTKGNYEIQICQDEFK